MALVLSHNCKFDHKTFSPRNPNFKFNHSQFSVQFPDNHPALYSSSSSSFISEWKLRRRFLVCRNSGEDPVRSGLEDNEVNSLGVEAALSMLRFYKRELLSGYPDSNLGTETVNLDSRHHYTL
ncbi:hypothetical protein OROHE_013220 [Orobanche hederae]